MSSSENDRLPQVPQAGHSYQVRTACNRDCPDACGIVATVQGGRVVRLQGDREHPVTRGFLCHRTSRFLDRQYSPDRILTPLRRRGRERVPISWDEALDELAERMRTIRAESGPAAILHYRCGGSMGLMKHVTDYFFERFGPVTIKSGDICTGAGDAAQLRDFGEEDSHDLFDLYHSRTIVLWGKNLHVGSVHLIPILREARRRGARIVLIDPVWHRTVDLCDRFLQPRPGGDIPLALGVARILCDRDQVDPEAATYCDHLDAFRELARSRTVDQWAREADVATSALEQLASDYANRPLATVVGWGMQRRARGAATIRVVDALATVSGNLGIPGGGVSFYFKRRGGFDTSFVRGEEVAPRTIPEPLLGRGILEARDPPIRMVWVTAANPVAMLPDSRTVAAALESREFTVVVDSFLTDTARAAHLVLPATTMLEDDDLLGAYGHHWMAELRPVVPPPPDVKSDYAILAALAPKLGLDECFTRDVAYWKRRLLQPVAAHGVSLESLRTGAVRNPLAPNILYADRRFATASGRVNLIHQLPDPPPPPPAEWPLQLMPLATEKSQGAQWAAPPPDEPPPATVHPAAAAGFRDGDLALLESELGELLVRLRLDDRQRPDVVLMAKGGWLHQQRCANALVPAKLTDDGGCAVYYDTPVRLRKPRIPTDTD